MNIQRLFSLIQKSQQGEIRDYPVSNFLTALLIRELSFEGYSDDGEAIRKTGEIKAFLETSGLGYECCDTFVLKNTTTGGEVNFPADCLTGRGVSILFKRGLDEVKYKNRRKSGQRPPISAEFRQEVTEFLFEEELMTSRWMSIFEHDLVEVVEKWRFEEFLREIKTTFEASERSVQGFHNPIPLPP